MKCVKEIHSTRKALIILSLCGIIVLLTVAKKYETLKLVWSINKNSTQNDTLSGYYVTFLLGSGRLGNRMFQFAALVYVAQKTNREVVLLRDHKAQELERYFSLGVRTIERSCPCFSFAERVVSYDSRIENATRSTDAIGNRTIILGGFFQSWKYIEPIERLIRSHLKFRIDIEAFARDILRQTIPNGWTEGQFTRVGIHNRRGDMASSPTGFTYGFTTAPESYFKMAMKYFTGRYKLVQFIVVSDDTKWSRQYITYDNQSSSVNVTYSVKHSSGQDMAILSLCDHVIISTGTFGWMAAWLANGTTVYYSNYPRNGSALAKRINHLDYYPPHWIPME